MTSREKNDCIVLEKRLNEVYWMLVKDKPDVNYAAACIESIQFALAVLRGYKGD